VRAGSFGEFVVIARARRQGTRWGGSFKINRFDAQLTASIAYDEEQSLEDTYESAHDAEDAAFDEGRRELERRSRRSSR
jgi:hypothetical protein